MRGSAARSNERVLKITKHFDFYNFFRFKMPFGKLLELTTLVQNFLMVTGFPAGFPGLILYA